MELYHVLNRGVDKRIIFLDNQDRARFVHDMYEFNSPFSAQNTIRTFNKAKQEHVSPSPQNVRLRKSNIKREQLVDIHGWVLMGNHYHLLLSERVEGGLTLFLRRLNIGYAKYFNERHTRVGTLFQGRTKKILVGNDAHFMHILHYIHFNPLDLHADTKKWRDFRIKNSKAALEYLAKYRWSSYQDYIGVKNFPSILTTSLFEKFFGNYKNEAVSYLKEISGHQLDSFLLE